MSPVVLFRSEIGGAADASGRAPLSQYELATALAMTLSDWPADDILWAAADKGELKTADQLRVHIKRLLTLNTPDGSFFTTNGTNAPLTPLQRFLKEYFLYDRALTIFKDGNLFPDHNATSLVYETDQFLGSVLHDNGRKDFLKALLTTDKVFVTFSNNIHTAPFTYGIADLPRTEDNARPSNRPGQRSGILTQPAFLVAFSDSDRTKPVQRGRFVAENLLCEQVPELPIGTVPPLTDLGPDATMRERLAVHSKNAGCAACHQMMDHLGLSFEIFDHLGRYRTADGTKAIDASGALFGNEGAGSYKDALELTALLASSPKVSQCFVRQAFRFVFGRTETTGDGCALVAAADAYTKSGGDLVELLTALFASQSSLTRVAQ